jgi:segregation and condensation protein A
MLENNIQVKLNQFDGPLALLLHLIQEEEMSIKDLDLTKITKQYLDFLAQMKDLNFDLAGEYLFLAATLILLKSKSSLELEEAKLSEDELNALGKTGIRSKADLIKRLEDLARFQVLGNKIYNLEKKGVDTFTRPKIDRKAILNSILTPMDLTTLTMTMVDILRREKRKFTMIKRDRLSIKEKLRFLKERLRVGDSADFFALIGEQKTTDDVVITFISLLELARLQKIKVFQNEEMGNIFVDVVQSLDDFDVETANGFETEEELQAKEDKKLDEEIKSAPHDEKAFEGETTIIQ